MKLLFDENLSPRLVDLLFPLFPESNHVRNEIAINSRWEWSKKSVQSSPESIEGKAAAILASGAYSQYVSTAKWRERR